MPLDVIIEKHPTERFSIGLDFAPRMPEGATIVSGTVAAYGPGDTLATGTFLVSPTATVSGTVLLATVVAGATGTTYKVIFTALLDSASQVIQDGLSVAVKAL